MKGLDYNYHKGRHIDFIPLIVQVHLGWENGK